MRASVFLSFKHQLRHICYTINFNVFHLVAKHVRTVTKVLCAYRRWPTQRWNHVTPACCHFVGSYLTWQCNHLVVQDRCPQLLQTGARELFVVDAFVEMRSF